MRLSKLRREDIERWQAERLAGRARGERARSGGVLGSTVDKELMRLKHLLNRAVSWGYLKRTARRGHGFGGHDVDAQFEFKY